MDLTVLIHCLFREYNKPLLKIHTVTEKTKGYECYSQPITNCELNEKSTLKIKSAEQTTTRDYILNPKFL